MVSREKIDEFICRAHNTACSHGFHDVERSDEHFLMLVLSEIGEMVEADRKNKHASIVGFKTSSTDFLSAFVSHIKDTVEDELADVVIRLCDFCGKRGIFPQMPNSGVLEMPEEFKKIFKDMSVCEQCFAMSCLVSDISRIGGDDDVEKEHCLGIVFSFCFEFARFHGIDLVWHIEQKQRYNESRPTKHGKNY